VLSCAASVCCSNEMMFSHNEHGVLCSLQRQLCTHAFAIITNRTQAEEAEAAAAATAAATTAAQQQATHSAAAPLLAGLLHVRSRRSRASQAAATAAVTNDLAEALRGTCSSSQRAEIELAVPACGLCSHSFTKSNSSRSSSSGSTYAASTASTTDAADDVDDVADDTEDADAAADDTPETQQEEQALLASLLANSDAPTTSSTASSKAAAVSRIQARRYANSTSTSSGKRENLLVSKYTQDATLLSMNEQLANDHQFGVLVNSLGKLLLGKQGPKVQFQLDKVSYCSQYHSVHYHRNALRVALLLTSSVFAEV
jgi:hypothetical protein